MIWYLGTPGVWYLGEWYGVTVGEDAASFYIPYARHVGRR